MESELEIVGGYCLDMSVGMVVWLFWFLFLPAVADENELCKKPLAKK